MKVDDSVSRAYRSTFGEYATKLDALQRLLECNREDKMRVESAIQDVESARRAYHSAREILASQLGVKSQRAVKAAIC